MSEDELYKIINGNNVPTTNNRLTSTFKIPNYNENNEDNKDNYYYIYIGTPNISIEFKDTITQTKTVKFISESEFSGYVFIWPENCKLKLEDTSLIYDIIDKNIFKYQSQILIQKCENINR